MQQAGLTFRNHLVMLCLSCTSALPFMHFCCAFQALLLCQSCFYVYGNACNTCISVWATGTRRLEQAVAQAGVGSACEHEPRSACDATRHSGTTHSCTQSVDQPSSDQLSLNLHSVFETDEGSQQTMAWIFAYAKALSIQRQPAIQHVENCTLMMRVHQRPQHTHGRLA